MTKRSIVFVFIVVFVLAAALQTRVEVKAGYSKSFEIVQKKKEQNIAYFSALAESLFLTGRRDILEGHLNDAIKIRLLDFFIISYNGEMVSSGSIRKLSEAATITLLQKQPTDQILSFDSTYESESSIRKPTSVRSGDSIENFRFMATDLGQGWDIKLGINLDREAFFEEMNNLVEDENRRMFIAASLLAIAIFIFVSRDLRNVAMGLRRQGAHKSGKTKTFSAEAEALQNGIIGYEEVVDRLKEDRRVLSAQVLPSLRTELQSGKVPPYEFDCTMVRTDINNFSQIFRTYPTEEFLETINRFFVDCSHIISRYHGLIHEFVGDEIIFYLKDDDHVNSFTAALACIDEINTAADRQHRASLERGAYPFRVKSSLAHGKIRFGPLLDGFSLAGAPLIETTRVLSAVQEKNENTVHFDAVYMRFIHEGIEWVNAFSVVLKGLDGERQIMRYLGHQPLSKLMETPALRALSLADYRDPKSVVEIIQVASRSRDVALIRDVNSCVKRIQMSEENTPLAVEMFEAIQRLVDLQKEHGPEELAKARETLLATLISSLGRLHLSYETLKGLRGWSILTSLFSHVDHRVVANTLETLGRWHRAFSQQISSSDFSKLVDNDQLRRLTESESSRVVANAIVLLGTIEISKDVIRMLEHGLRSSQPNVVASMRYAISEIASYYRDIDPVYLRTQIEFGRLVARVEQKASA